MTDALRMAARIIDVLTHGWLLWWIICNFVVCILFANVLICLIFSILICFRRIVFSFSIIVLLLASGDLDHWQFEDKFLVYGFLGLKIFAIDPNFAFS